MKKTDFRLLGAVLAVILAVLAVTSLSKKEGDYVLVRVNGQEAARYSLSKDGEYALNGGTNVLRIENGKAYLISADCPDHLCVHQGKIDQHGETITCLPNRLTVTVFRAKTDDVDLVS